MLTSDEQETLLTLVDRITKRRAESREDAARIAALGCQCDGDPHARTCPVSIAIEVLADVAAAGPSERGKDIRHLAQPHTAKRASRAECETCGRYARRRELIRHKEGCENA